MGRKNLLVMKNKTRAQSILEYVILVITIAGAFIAMNVYIQRAVNARLHNMEIDINPRIITQ